MGRTGSGFQMRTYGFVLAFGLTAIVLAGSAAAAPAEVNNLLQELGLPPIDPKAGDKGSDLAAPEAQVTAPDVANGNGLLATVLVPVEAISNTLMILGLQLVASLFAGFGESSEMVAQAAATAASQPVTSTAIATVAIAMVGGAISLGHLIQRYGGLGGIPLYTRIAKSELLENGVRQQIMDLITHNPGINVSEISRRLDIAWGTATHHLQKLRHEKLVNIRVASNQKCYFPNGGTYTPREMDVMSATKSPTARNIAEFLVKNGPTCHRDITDALGLTPALVSFHAAKLVQNGLVARHRDGRRTIFTPLEANLDPAPRAVVPH